MNTQLQQESFGTDHLSERLINSATRIMRGFVRLFMGRMTFDVMVEILRRVMVEEGSRKVAEENDGKVILSRVSLLTGVRTQVIKEFQEEKRKPHQCNLTLESRLLNLWANDPQYQDPKTGKPLELIIHGGGCTFQRLVSSVAGRGVTTQTVLERLAATGNVAVINDHWVRLLNVEWFTIENMESEMLEAGSFNTESQMLTMLHNIDNPEDRWVERTMWSVTLPPDRLPELREYLNNALKGFYSEMVQAICDHEDQNLVDLNDVLSGVGLYYWERKDSKRALEIEDMSDDFWVTAYGKSKPQVVKLKGESNG